MNDFRFLIKSKHGIFEVIVDNEDTEAALSRKWSITKTNNYIRVEARINKKCVRFHRYLLGVTDKNIEIDHINRNPLDNRRSNLRIASREQNMRNVTFKSRPNKTGYIDVYKSNQKYCACISINDKTFHIGRYETPEQAAIARDQFAYKTSGEFAILNFPDLIKKDKTNGTV